MIDLLPLLSGVRPNGKGYLARCPAHDDQNPSLSIDRGEDGRILLKCFAGCSADAICAALKITPADLFESNKPTRERVVAEYKYEDESGKLLYAVRRFEPKSFKSFRPDGQCGINGVRRVLYRLPDVIAARQNGETIYICEGEKDCDAMAQRGLCATCNPFGACAKKTKEGYEIDSSKWQESYTESLRGADVVIIPDNDDPGRKHAELVASKLQGVAKSVRTIKLPTGKDAHDFFASGGTAEQLAALPDEGAPKTLAQEIAERRFDETAEPPAERPIYSVCGIPICTPGNLQVVNAQAKSGKSAVLGAMLSATFALNGADTLGFTSTNPDGKAVLHFDTEQSRAHHWRLVKRAKKRASADSLPAWVQSYCFTDFGARKARQAVWHRAETAAQEFGGIHSILIDGVADLVADVNDAEECNAFVADLHALAIRFDCSITGIIHQNPNGDKTRGHLGSQLERKAETNLRLDKDGETISVWSDKQRCAPILKGKGPRFQWDDEKQMHVSVQPGLSPRESERMAEAIDLRDDVFQSRPSMRRCDIEQEIQVGTKCGAKTAQRTVSKWASWGLIEKSVAGLWIPKR